MERCHQLDAGVADPVLAGPVDPTDDLIRARLSNTFDSRSPENGRGQRVASRIDSDDRGKEFLITSRLNEASRVRSRPRLEPE